MTRVYLDWNATAPLRPEARDAMIAAMDVVGNPSSVHAEGRKAKAIVETARGQIAVAIGASREDVVLTSGATEAISLVYHQSWDSINCSPLEHDAVIATNAEIIEREPFAGKGLVNQDGLFDATNLVSGYGIQFPTLKKGENGWPRKYSALFGLTAANSEIGTVQMTDLAFKEFVGEADISHRFCDATQAFGKIPFTFSWAHCEYSAISSHKIGGPKGVGALLVKSGEDIAAQIKGGGQEQGRRSGTENVIGIAGFGAAAEAAQQDLDNGVWEPVRELRDALEARLADAAPDAIFVGQGVDRLPNTSCIAVPGWKGETQVMQMDLAGYAISAGSACSSGKVKQSRVLTAMGFDDITASSAIRVSFGPTTTPDEVMGFADAWIAQYKKFKARAA